MKVCSQCVLDENFPRISFDEEGICNYCRTSKKSDAQKDQRAKYEQKFLELIDRYRGNGNYDCLVAFS